MDQKYHNDHGLATSTSTLPGPAAAMVAAVDRQEEASTTLPIPTLNRRRIGGCLKFSKDFVGGENLFGGPKISRVPD